MSRPLRVILEIGKKRKVAAGATDWPGLDRWGTSEESAIAKLVSYIPRYADVARRAGLASELKHPTDVEVVERVPGSSSTDFWGIAHVPSQFEHQVLSTKDLERKLHLLQACWAYFDDVANRVSEELQLGPRGGGRSRDRIIVHVYASERHNFWRKVGLREDDELRLTPDELADFRGQYLGLIRSYNAEGKPARAWGIQFLIRRTAQHVMDHAWEMEDRDLSPA
jgi:hypothetical protein